jgi:hypothetical protein
MVIFHSYVSLPEGIKHGEDRIGQFQMFQKANVPEKLWREVPILWILTNWGPRITNIINLNYAPWLSPIPGAGFLIPKIYWKRQEIPKFVNRGGLPWFFQGFAVFYHSFFMVCHGVSMVFPFFPLENTHLMTQQAPAFQRAHAVANLLLSGGAAPATAASPPYLQRLWMLRRARPRVRAIRQVGIPCRLVNLSF